MKKWLAIFSLILLQPLTFACQGDTNPEGSSDNSSTLASSGKGELQIQFLSPEPGPVPEGIFTVSINVTPLNSLQSLRLLVNNQQVKIFTRLPFEFQIDPALYPGDLELKVESTDFNGKATSETLLLTETTTSTSTLLSKNSGTLDPNCMNNNNYDACLFWKNPVAQNGAAFSHKVQFGDDLSSVQTFGVKLINRTSTNSLRNNSISVYASGGQTAVPNGTGWKYPYQSDSRRFNAQLMSYFWLTLQETEMVRRTGSFYARNKNIQVDAYNSNVKDNAYWDSQKIVMGYASNNGSPVHEMALSAEIYLHEMGHANLQFAVGGYQNLIANSSYESGNSCTSSAGCIGGINEGQADFHFLILFNDSTPLGETWKNSVYGLTSRDVSRNLALTASQAFSASGGEIHTMGAFYASVLWSIYSNPGVVKSEFEKIFSSHLQKLSGSSRFAEARDALIATDLALYNGKYKSIIEAAFAKKGI